MNIPHRDRGELPPECLGARLALDEASRGPEQAHLRDCPSCSAWAARVGQLEKGLKSLPPVGVRDRALKVLARANAQGVEWAFSIPQGGDSEEHYQDINKRARGRTNAARKLSYAAGILAALLLLSVGMWLGKHQEQAYQQRLASNSSGSGQEALAPGIQTDEAGGRKLGPAAKMEAWYFVSAQLQDQVSGVFSHSEKEVAEERNERMLSQGTSPMAGQADPAKAQELSFQRGMPQGGSGFGGGPQPAPGGKPDASSGVVFDTPGLPGAPAQTNAPGMAGKSVVANNPSHSPPAPVALHAQDGVLMRAPKIMGAKVESPATKERTPPTATRGTEVGKDNLSKVAETEGKKDLAKDGPRLLENRDEAGRMKKTVGPGPGDPSGLSAPPPGKPGSPDLADKSPKEPIPRYVGNEPPNGIQQATPLGLETKQLGRRPSLNFYDSISDLAEWVVARGGERSNAREQKVRLKEKLPEVPDTRFLKVEAQLQVVATNLKELAPKMLDSALQLPESERKAALTRLAKEWENQESVFQRLAAANEAHKESLGKLVAITKKAREDAIREAAKLA